MKLDLAWQRDYCNSLMHDPSLGFQYPSAHWSHLIPVYPSIHSHWPLSCRTEVNIIKYWNVVSYRTKVKTRKSHRTEVEYQQIEMKTRNDLSCRTECTLWTLQDNNDQQSTYNIAHSSNSPRGMTVTRHTAINHKRSRPLYPLNTGNADALECGLNLNQKSYRGTTLVEAFSTSCMVTQVHTYTHLSILK